MKRIAAFAATAILACVIIVASCSKTNEDDPTGNWTCHCTVTSSGGTYPVDIPINNTTKSYAQSTCATAQANYTTSGSTATCTLN